MNLKIMFYMGSCKKSVPTDFGKYYFWICRSETAQLRTFAPMSLEIILTDIR